MPNLHEIWDPNEWEDHAYGLLQDRHGVLNLQKVPARHKGDHGLDYYCLKDQVVYQCYAVLEPCDVADRADKQKAKITIDLGKFCAKGKEICALLGSVQIARWILVVPLHDSAQVNAHATAKSAEVKALGLSYVAPDFEVMIHALDSFDQHSISMRATARRSLSIPDTPTTPQQIEEWSSSSESLVVALRKKLSKRVGVDSEKLDNATEDSIRWFIERENSLEFLRSTVPQIHDALMGVIIRHGQKLSFSGPPATGAAHAILRAELEALVSALKAEIPNFTNASAHQLAMGTVADWLMRCPLDFPPYDHVT